MHWTQICRTGSHLGASEEQSESERQPALASPAFWLGVMASLSMMLSPAPVSASEPSRTGNISIVPLAQAQRASDMTIVAASL
jgi:hypothetical protein